MRGVRRRRRTELLELDEVERRLRPFGRRYVGVRAVPLDRLVGTDGKARAFTRDFAPRHAFTRDRLRSLADAFPDGGFPPIVVVKLGETYFVIDGHHRAALARRNGADTIEADVTELVARVPLPPGADMVEVVLRELERIFLDESGLARARPGARLSASRPAIYLELLENLQVHGYHLMRERQRAVTDEEIAADWHDNVYAPLIATVARDWLGKEFQEAPDADLFLLLHRRRREEYPSCGCPPLVETAAGATAEAARKRGLRRLLRSG